MLMIIPFAAFLIGLLLGYLPLRSCYGEVTWAFIASLIGFGAWLLFKELTVPGLDGVMYTLLGLFVVTPSLIATLIGAALAHLRPREMC
ncbi:hypothetical protein J7443_22890 [Tropicibacter sp. R15_0]|uniref:hypothetical protein n=1 Tax=Tropicibacter sp. R15_0 TaxID=2821101 RepID=UPI001ADA2294|nr:hypothetical protein [Tropicibacter sp. R15_0]MBO9468090.1 hypothetical protein [Tropicibacter sp. R15_0]